VHGNFNDQEIVMGGTKKCRLFTSVVVLVTVALTGAAEPKTKSSVKVLGKKMFVQMDADKDNKVSKTEYIDFGAAHLKKRGKRANRSQIGRKFLGFDRDGDGFITDADPTYKSPLETLEEKISGTWICEKTKQGPISFVFMENGKADVIQNGESTRELAGDVVRYRFVHPKRTPTCLDVVVDQGRGSDFYFKCIIQFISEDQIKMRMTTGNEFAVRPKDFPVKGGTDTIILKRSTI
jgi:hypothetical protein